MPTSSFDAYSAYRASSAVTASTYAAIANPNSQVVSYGSTRVAAPVGPSSNNISITSPYSIARAGGISAVNPADIPTVSSPTYNLFGAGAGDSQTGATTEQTNSYSDALKRAYDLQRQQATAEGETARSAMTEAAKARLAGSGIDEDSGLYQKQLQRAEIEAQRQTAGKLGALDVAQFTAESNQGFQKDLATMQNAFAEGRIRLEDSLRDSDTSAKAVSDAYYSRGIAGEEIPAAELEALKTSNPTAYYSYMNGKAGKTVDENNKDFEDRIAFRNALILRLNPNDANFTTQLAEAFKAGTEGWDSISATSFGPKEGDVRTVSNEDGTFREERYVNGEWVSVAPSKSKGVIEGDYPDYRTR